eukprot:CAMPEP_0185272202 /NCGR_PEP_ID=MMETSP1359-20130426/46645_1 /TAXON_ID=552665 /ORGANISM="Bigelowiella longifila, Strain CCMP242" /LENGTH=60 /DNA_ID=CAMNT_0027864405 /DNA_START=41 /DNA_END=219 /DNA_ORIENTATION=+
MRLALRYEHVHKELSRGVSDLHQGPQTSQGNGFGDGAYWEAYEAAKTDSNEKVITWDRKG